MVISESEESSSSGGDNDSAMESSSDEDDGDSDDDDDDDDDSGDDSNGGSRGELFGSLGIDSQSGSLEAIILLKNIYILHVHSYCLPSHSQHHG